MPPLQDRIKRMLQNTSPAELARRPGLGWIRRFAGRAELWRLCRRSVPRGMAIGCFCAMLPIPLQTVPAAALAVLVRGNLLVAAAMVWITNPITIVPILYVNTLLGGWILMRPPAAEGGAAPDPGVLDSIGQIGAELFIGSIAAGVLLAVVGYAVGVLGHRIYVARRWSGRKSKRLAE
ncbi:MAG: DUF2062 domain-containing protein [Gammaproteobacteria bacterium AqS3]|nr:DUF2062 domain-containing protein [Gammaproteobacteria bacterium AqS3]